MDPIFQSIRHRFLNYKTILSIVIAILVLIFIFLKIDFSEVLNIIINANPWWYLAAFIVYYASFFLRGYRWKIILKQVDVGTTTITAAGIVFVSYFVNSILPAKLGDVYKGYLAKKKYNIPVSTALGTIFVERFYDFVLLVLIIGLTGFVLLEKEMPTSVFTAVVIGLFLCIVLTVLVLLLLKRKDFLFRLFSEKYRIIIENFHQGVTPTFKLKIVTPLVLLTTGIWFLEALRFFLVTKAVGVSVPISLILLTAFVAALLTSIPLTPAGLGAVEFAIISIFVVFNYDTGMAGAIALMDRFITFWCLLIFGAVYILLKEFFIKDPAG